eukprot:1575118-Pleurochrysis_carterae.AAC.3
MVLLDASNPSEYNRYSLASASQRRASKTKIGSEAGFPDVNFHPPLPPQCWRVPAEHRSIP